MRANWIGPDREARSTERVQRRVQFVAVTCVRRRREDREHQQASAAGVADAVRNAFGRDQQIAGLHRQLAAIEQEQPLAFDHLVDLVLSGVRVQRVFLAGLERIEADQQARRFEDGGLAHLLRRVDGMIGRVDDAG